MIGASMRKASWLIVAIVLVAGGAVQALQPASESRWDNNAGFRDRLESRPVPKSALCGQWWQMLRDLGWAEVDVQKADAIIHRESRCLPSAYNPADPTQIGKWKGSIGLFQINLFWLQKTTAYPQGFLQTHRVAQKPADLFNPLVNARAAQAIIAYNRGIGGCGWMAWRGC
jgi:soluble lytic murein transglycosylase-like protein